ncbi:hypothetical protein SAMN05660330_00516 [Desulforhopalus singaporensis]|uniref:Uncharacterized protein n=2 Tax=Desulforhopalus singaporensis TaxID=91360 RepID=A0A1H0KIG1_9BACT|nr:hypothetical protein SAMN05660330_00516 [Desulforhopalus singaporensis]
MAKCTVHPERDTSYQCHKHKVWLCRKCLACRDPHIYCRYRSSCIIWFATKRDKENSLS